ncbi:unnamed protein product [Didymodactylos carnosus]|uniref:Uncharacterized protein n=1 Tax=Didymodactylos carnosus TaxID=1234261 RepID=A0A8S2FEM5_9BILA|nr:unnamed protein product [Didymodactylos carnosus]CAF4240151.1 unnamed protein product [Didymodactylos carnosus]
MASQHIESHDQQTKPKTNTATNQGALIEEPIRYSIKNNEISLEYSKSTSYENTSSRLEIVANVMPNEVFGAISLLKLGFKINLISHHPRDSRFVVWYVHPLLDVTNEGTFLSVSLSFKWDMYQFVY